MPNDLHELLTRAVADVEADPFLGQRVVAHGRRRRARMLRIGVVLASVVLLAAGALVAIAPWRSNVDSLTPAATPTTEARDDSALTNGVVGPNDRVTGRPTRVLGQAYRVGTQLRDGREVTQVLYPVAPGPSSPGSRPYAFCLVFWQEGTPLADAEMFACPRGSVGTDDAVLQGENNVSVGHDGTDIFDRLTVLRTDVVRADVKLAYPDDLPATATPAGGTPPTRRRLPVQIYGLGDPRMPYLLGVYDPVPSGFVTIGTDAWNAAGRQLVRNDGPAELTYLHGFSCGPSPKDGMTYRVCPG